MFEKKAEEYAIENWEHYEEGQNDSKALKQAYLAGAQFGYNKAVETEQFRGKTMFEKKAEEWVKNVFPNDEFKQSGISRALVDFAELGYNKANERLTKATELLTKWVELFSQKGGNIPKTPIQVETEQFLMGVKK